MDIYRERERERERVTIAQPALLPALLPVCRVCVCEASFRVQDLGDVGYLAGILYAKQIHGVVCV